MYRQPERGPSQLGCGGAQAVLCLRREGGGAVQPQGSLRAGQPTCLHVSWHDPQLKAEPAPHSPQLLQLLHALAQQLLHGMGHQSRSICREG